MCFWVCIFGSLVNCITNFVFSPCCLFTFESALVAMEHNLDDLCGDVMSMNLSDKRGTSLASKSDAGSGIGQKSGLDN